MMNTDMNHRQTDIQSVLVLNPDTGKKSSGMRAEPLIPAAFCVMWKILIEIIRSD